MCCPSSSVKIADISGNMVGAVDGHGDDNTKAAQFRAALIMYASSEICKHDRDYLRGQYRTIIC